MNGGRSGSGALAGLVGQYGSGDSSGEEDEDNESTWCTCFDPTTGCPYYWNRITNEVSWEPPPPPPPPSEPPAPPLKSVPRRPPAKCPEPSNVKQKRPSPPTDDDQEKIELITSYYNSDSGSGDEQADDPSPNKNITYGPELPDQFKTEVNGTSIKKSDVPPSDKKEVFDNTNEAFKANASKTAHMLNSKMLELNKADAAAFSNKKKRLDEGSTSYVQDKNNQNITEGEDSGDVDNKTSNIIDIDNVSDTIATQAPLLKKLIKSGPGEVKYLNGSSGNSPIVSSRTQSPLGSPLTALGSPAPVKKSTALEMDVDDLIAQIEMEQPIDQPSQVSDAQSNETNNSHDGSTTTKSNTTENSSDTKNTASFKPLFPSAVNFGDTIATDEVVEKVVQNLNSDPVPVQSDQPSEKVVVNKYEAIMDNDGIENAAFKRKRRLALDVLPNKHPKTADDTNFTKYALSEERKGLGFSVANSEDTGNESDKGKSAYGNFKKGEAISFQKGEASDPSEASEVDGDKTKRSEAEEKFDDMDDKKNLIESKLKFLIQSLPPVPPVQQLYIEMQTLWSALASGALKGKHMHEWLHSADSTLGRLEASAAPHPWICRFHSEAGCYVYEHSETGQCQWEYPEPKVPPPPTSPPPEKPPAPPSPPPDEPTDMDISTTPPPQSHCEIRSGFVDDTEPLPPGVETPVNHTPPPYGSNLSNSSNILQGVECVSNAIRKDDLCAELDSFYSDIAALEDTTPPTVTEPDKKPLPEVKPQSVVASSSLSPVTVTEKDKRKKIKVKTPSMGLKNKNVSNLVAKWMKVQESLDD